MIFDRFDKEIPCSCCQRKYINDPKIYQPTEHLKNQQMINDNAPIYNRSNYNQNMPTTTYVDKQFDDRSSIPENTIFDKPINNHNYMNEQQYNPNIPLNNNFENQGDFSSKIRHNIPLNNNFENQDDFPPKIRHNIPINTYQDKNDINYRMLPMKEQDQYYSEIPDKHVYPEKIDDAYLLEYLLKKLNLDKNRLIHSIKKNQEQEFKNFIIRDFYNDNPDMVGKPMREQYSVFKVWYCGMTPIDNYDLEKFNEKNNIF